MAQNLLDQLAAVGAFYRAFLKPYLPRENHQQYRKVVLEKWEAYDRHKEVRHWMKSWKCIDQGRLEFNEQGNAFGQGLLRNLLMYLAERQEPDGQPARFFAYARACAEDIIRAWDFGNPVHTWDGVEAGWRRGYVFGTGELGPVRGALDGSPTDAAFPFQKSVAVLVE